MLQGLSGVGEGVASEAPCHEVHLAMVVRSARVNIVSVMLLPHHLVVRVDEVTACVPVPPRLQLGPVLDPASGAVHRNLVLGVVAASQYNRLLHLDAASVPDNEMMLVCIYTSRYLHPAH